MIPKRPAADESGAPDQPGPAAHLKITAERMGGLSAEGKVPSSDARYLITTFGIMGTVGTSTFGAVIVLPGAPDIALAQLILGFVATVLIAVCGRPHRLASAAMRERGEGGELPSAE